MKNNAPEKNKYGYEGDAAKQLTRIAYKIQVYEPAKKDADKLYVKADGTGYILAKGAANGTEFFIKENNELKAQSEMRAEGEAVSYYALVEKALDKAAGVKHPSLMLSHEDLTSSTTDLDNSVAAFAFIDVRMASIVAWVRASLMTSRTISLIPLYSICHWSRLASCMRTRQTAQPLMATRWLKIA